MTAVFSTRFSFLAVAILFVFHVTEAGQLCGICSQMVDPRDCDVVGECGDHEVCSLSRYATPTGRLLYDMGCESTQGCSPGTGRRNVDVPESSRLASAGHEMICSACCNDTNFCNVINGHCGSQALDLTGSVLCYNCDYMHSPDQCDRVRTCSVFEQCYLGTKLSGLSGSLLWTSRCGIGTQGCQGSFTTIPLDGVVGKRQFPAIGSGCCKDNFCNNKVPSTSQPQPKERPTTTTTKIIPTTTTTKTTPTSTNVPLSKPVITFVTRLHDVKKGSYIHLTCRATGNPTPVLSWNYFAIGDVRPTNVRGSNHGADVYIDGVTDLNYGHYACKAHNSQGDDTRYVEISEHGPRNS